MIIAHMHDSHIIIQEGVADRSCEAPPEDPIIVDLLADQFRENPRTHAT